MKISEIHTFENRYDGGVKLADKLKEYKERNDVIVLAIPNGGVPVAAPVAFTLGCPLDFVICRKLPVPLRPEGGFGAVADDGSYILYPEMVRAFDITEEQIVQQVHKVRQDVRERILRFRAGHPMPVLNGKTVIVIDDGLASGYTMLAAIESLRRRRPKEIIAAAPTASASAVKLLEKTADKVVSVVTDFTPSFYVSKYYHFWHNMEDDETMRCIEEFHAKRGFQQLSGAINNNENISLNKPATTLYGYKKTENKTYKDKPLAKDVARPYNTDDVVNQMRYKNQRFNNYTLEEREERYNEAKRRYLEKTLFKDDKKS